MSRKIWRKKNPFWPVIAQQETRNLLFNQPDDTIPFLNLETHHSTLKEGLAAKKKNFPSETIKTSGLLAA